MASTAEEVSLAGKCVCVCVGGGGVNVWEWSARLNPLFLPSPCWTATTYNARRGTGETQTSLPPQTPRAACAAAAVSLHGCWCAACNKGSSCANWGEHSGCCSSRSTCCGCCLNSSSSCCGCSCCMCSRVMLMSPCAVPLVCGSGLLCSPWVSPPSASTTAAVAGCCACCCRQMHTPSNQSITTRQLPSLGLAASSVWMYLA